jgi:uncharacterized membrane protein (DUF2068 family)
MSVQDEIQRPDFGLRVIIVWKTIKGVLLIALAVTVFLLRHSDIHALATDLVDWLGLDPTGPRLHRWLDRLLSLTPNRIVTVGVGALVVAGIMFLEAWGLHRRRRWAEWLTVIVTSALIPLEVYHLATHPSLGKVLTLVANVAIVVYLLRHRWLFLPGRIGRWWRARRAAKT